MPDPSKWKFLPAFVRAPRFLAVLGLTVLASGALVAGIGLGAWRTVCHDCPSIAQIYVYEPERATKILSHDGQLIAELFQRRRTPVSIESLPPHVPQAFIAIEDRRFYDHGGVDFIGITRSMVNLAMQGRIVGGGSTITQQLARNMFEEEIGFEQRIRRKLKEVKVAKELERFYTKDQILEAYINQVVFGSGWYGIETAAQRFFGKEAKDLDVAEAALLAAVINLPERYSPFRNPERALQRRNTVLSRMAREGFITAEEAGRWQQALLPTEPFGNEDGDLAPYFVEWVRRTLDSRYGPDLYRKGYRVYTTLDADMQRFARTAMERSWERVESLPGYRHPKYADVMARKGEPRGSESPYLQGAFVSLDPRTGDVTALIGGRDFNDSKFNRAVQALRQPGSTFKPFVYTAALASGIPASHVVHDAPVTLTLETGATWSPRNYDPGFLGPMTMREALKKSINTIAVKVSQEVGIETIAQYARRMGIETSIPRVPSVAIGAAEVIPIQIAEAYGVLATQGMRVRPRNILRIEDSDGRLMWEARPPEPERVLDPAVAAISASMLQGVVDNGTGFTGIRAGGKLPYNIPAAGKTGTTNDGADVWFIGFTPDLLAAVWFGFDRRTTIARAATGGAFAAPVWGDFMREVYVGENAVRSAPAPWSMPAEVIQRRIDPLSGRLAAEWCPGGEAPYTEYFILGTEPTEYCDVMGGGGGGGLFGAPFRNLPPEVPPDTGTDVRFRR